MHAIDSLMWIGTVGGWLYPRGVMLGHNLKLCRVDLGRVKGLGEGVVTHLEVATI